MKITNIVVRAGAVIPLSRGMHAIVDADDFLKFGHLKWYAQRGWGGTFYAARRDASNQMVWLHKEIMGAKSADYVDHRAGNTLDDRKSNLRICTNAQNGQNRVRANKNNTSGYKGVFWHKRAAKWMAQITVERKTKYLGLFQTIQAAAEAYNNAAMRLHGQFASLNSI